MIPELTKIRIQKKNKTSNMIYDIFEKRYNLGTAGLVGAVSIASLSVTNTKPLSVIMIAPSGQMKSQITRDLNSIFTKNSIIIPSRFTPYGLSKKMGEPQLNNKTWLINDMVRTFDGLSQTKISEIVGWLSEILSEGRAGSMTAQDSELKCRMNLVSNIALVSYMDLHRKFITSTLNERILQFSYFVEKENVRKNTDRNYKISEKTEIELNPSEIKISKKQKELIYEYSDKLTTIAHYEKHSMRPDEIITSFLCGHAKLNQRNSLDSSDFSFLNDIFIHFKKVI